MSGSRTLPGVVQERIDRQVLERIAVARAIAEAAGDGVFDRDEDCASDDEDRDYWLRLADAALSATAVPRG